MNLGQRLRRGVSEVPPASDLVDEKQRAPEDPVEQGFKCPGLGLKSQSRLCLDNACFIFLGGKKSKKKNLFENKIQVHVCGKEPVIYFFSIFVSIIVTKEGINFEVVHDIGLILEEWIQNNLLFRPSIHADS